MKVLIACECSGVVRRAFRARGHDAWSCDLLPAEDGDEHHLQCDVLTVLDRGWNLMIAHPECTHLSLSGARWCVDHWIKRKKGNRWHDGSEKRRLRKEAAEFLRTLLDYKAIPKRCIEQPMSMASTLVAKFDQRIHPWQFGHGETKETWLWLRGLPPLVPTNIVEGREHRIHKEPPGPDRKRNRSRTFTGIAEAMATQWSNQ